MRSAFLHRTIEPVIGADSLWQYHGRCAQAERQRSTGFVERLTLVQERPQRQRALTKFDRFSLGICIAQERAESAPDTDKNNNP
jgi:hypothetical protein